MQTGLDVICGECGHLEWMHARGPCAEALLCAAVLRDCGCARFVPLREALQPVWVSTKPTVSRPSASDA